MEKILTLVCLVAISWFFGSMLFDMFSCILYDEFHVNIIPRTIRDINEKIMDKMLPIVFVILSGFGCLFCIVVFIACILALLGGI